MPILRMLKNHARDAEGLQQLAHDRIPCPTTCFPLRANAWANEANGANEAKEANEANEANGANEANEAKEANGANEAKEANEANGANEANEANGANEANEAKEANEANEANGANEANEAVAGAHSPRSGRLPTQIPSRKEWQVRSGGGCCLGPLDPPWAPASLGGAVRSIKVASAPEPGGHRSPIGRSSCVGLAPLARNGSTPLVPRFFPVHPRVLRLLGPMFRHRAPPTQQGRHHFARPRRHTRILRVLPRPPRLFRETGQAYGLDHCASV
jgi:hypothetical protein